MFSYNISTSADNEIFLNTCRIIEKQIKNIKKEQDIIDVDVVYVDSEVELVF